MIIRGWRSGREVLSPSIILPVNTHNFRSRPPTCTLCCQPAKAACAALTEIILWLNDRMCTVVQESLVWFHTVKLCPRLSYNFCNCCELRTPCNIQKRFYKFPQIMLLPMCDDCCELRTTCITQKRLDRFPQIMLLPMCDDCCELRTPCITRKRSYRFPQIMLLPMCDDCCELRTPCITQKRLDRFPQILLLPMCVIAMSCALLVLLKIDRTDFPKSCSCCKHGSACVFLKWLNKLPEIMLLLWAIQC